MAVVSSPGTPSPPSRVRALFVEHGYLAGPIGAAWAWIAILWAAYVNPWWNWTSTQSGALSYLGAPSVSVNGMTIAVTDPWIYNYVGMVPAGLLLLVFSLWLLAISRNRVEGLGSLLFALAGVLLVLIGIYHQGGMSQELHDLFAAWFFLQAFLAVLTWGIGLRREGRAPLGHIMVSLGVGTVALALLLLVVFHGLPGAVGEVLGVLGIDLWVLLLYFARADYPAGQLRDWERFLFTARPSVLHALQPRALVCSGAGLALFAFGYYYLTSHIASIVASWAGLSTILRLAEITLGAYFVGFLLVVAGAWRWRRALAPRTGATLFVLTLVPPLLCVFTWFNLLGFEVMMVYLLTVGTFLPLGLSLRRWRRSEYALTNQRVLEWERDPHQASDELPLEDVRSISVRQEGLGARFDVGDVTFHPDAFARAGPAREVTWEGVHHPRYLLSEARSALGAAEVGPRRRALPRRTWLVPLAVLIPVLLILTLVPVFAATTDLNFACGLYLSVSNIEKDPWPYIHNVTLPPGHASFTWSSGAPVYMVVLEIPPATVIENTNLTHISPGNLTVEGSGSLATYGGSVATLCVSLVQGTSVTIIYTYDAPLVWE